MERVHAGEGLQDLEVSGNAKWIDPGGDKSRDFLVGEHMRYSMKEMCTKMNLDADFARVRQELQDWSVVLDLTHQLIGPFYFPTWLLHLSDREALQLRASRRGRRRATISPCIWRPFAPTPRSWCKEDSHHRRWRPATPAYALENFGDLRGAGFPTMRFSPDLYFVLADSRPTN